jgi:hypothetical protein
LVAAVSVAVLFLAPPVSSVGSEEAGTPVSGSGVIVAVTGAVDVHSGGTSRPAVVGLVLKPGDALAVKAGGTCSGFAPDGEFFSLEGPSELQLAGETESDIAGRVSSWVKSQLTQWIGARRRQPLVTRSLLRDWGQELDAILPLIPAPDGHVRASRANFRWAGLPGVDAFTIVLVSETDEESQHLVRGHDVSIDELVPGQEYVWRVQARADDWGAESSWRSFRVMSAEVEDSLEAAIADLGDLEAGVLLLSSGLHEEAIARFDVSVSSGVAGRSARLWRARAMADVGLYKEAYDDLVAAGGLE